MDTGEVVSGPQGFKVDTGDVRRSGDDITDTGDVGAYCRSTLADTMGFNTSAWQTAGKTGFTSFIETLYIQSARIRTELGALGATLHDAAATYEREEDISASQLTLNRDPDISA